MQKTKDYEMFRRNTANRGINKENVQKIRESIQEKNMLHLRPIIVNKDMEVIDGQHRIEAAKELQLELFYIVHDDSEDEDMILLNNNQKKWTLHEYLNYFCDKGREEYIQFKKFLNEHDWIDITTSLALLGKNNGTEWGKFKKGSFDFVRAYQQNTDQILFAEEIVMMIKNTLITKDKRPFAGSRFITALSYLCKNENFDMDIFIRKIKGQLDRIHACATTEGYTKMLTAIYNYKNNNPL